MAENRKSGFSSNILAIAGLITAIGGLITILHQTKVISFGSEKEKTKTEVVNQQGKANNNNTLIESEVTHIDNTDIVSNLNNNSEVVSGNLNITGNWYDSINAGRYSFSQNGYGQISFQEHSYMEGTWLITAEGTGTVSGNQINIPYYTIYDTTGHFVGTINNNNSVTGTAQDYASGARVQLQLSRQ